LTLADARSARFVEQADSLLNDAYRLSGYLLGNAPDAEDAVQEALARAWQAWPSLRDKDRFEPWFDRILVNICRDKLRGKRRHQVEELDEESPVYSDDPFRAVLARAEIDRLVRVLSPDQRVVVGLRFWRDMSLQAIADLLDIPLGTVQSRLHSALQRLREASADGIGAAGPQPTPQERSSPTRGATELSLEPLRGQTRAGAGRSARGEKR
jgi:RNA polymerase sigma-70 factor (ECF subfamily)